MASLAWLAVGGFAPAGRLPLLVLAGFAAGLACILLTGRATPQASQSAAPRRTGTDAPRAVT